MVLQVLASLVSPFILGLLLGYASFSYCFFVVVSPLLFSFQDTLSLLPVTLFYPLMQVFLIKLFSVTGMIVMHQQL